MKTFRSVLFSIGLAVPVTLPAASTSMLSVHVPFSFVMGGQEFAPGDYRVVRTENGLVSIQGEGKAGLAISLPGTSLTKAAVPSSLQFTSKETREHLVGVQFDGTELMLAPEESDRKPHAMSIR